MLINMVGVVLVLIAVVGEKVSKLVGKTVKIVKAAA